MGARPGLVLALGLLALAVAAATIEEDAAALAGRSVQVQDGPGLLKALAEGATDIVLVSDALFAGGPPGVLQLNRSVTIRGTPGPGHQLPHRYRLPFLGRVRAFPPCGSRLSAGRMGELPHGRAAP